MKIERRRFLQSVSAAAAASTLPLSIQRAWAIPAQNRHRSLEDVEHIVILMQENRSFDHYFGTMRGVRGFEDPRAISLPSGAPVWRQPNGTGFVAPFHPDAPNLGLQFIEDLPHGWTDTHSAWNDGRYDNWVPAKGTTTMAYLTRDDIPYHFALADAFTVCDAYHCSFLGATDPNRYHMWTGWVGNDGLGGGPVLDNAEAGYDWSTYPERLQRNGVSWKIYQDVGLGLDADHFWGWDGDHPYVGNYGDNSLLYFHQYQNAPDGSPLALRARTGTDVKTSGNLVDQFAADVRANKLPQVSWIVAPESYTEHPNWPANYGAWYVSQFLDALTANPDLWSKTAFFLTYDENDGFFDHMVPPTPPGSRARGLSTVDTTNELYAGGTKYKAGPYGLGVRVPMVVISPWSRGGWVSSEVFDHTSLIQFIERRFAHGNADLIEKNITTWRRAVTGDLTSAFDFENPNDVLRHGWLSLPSTAAYAPPDRDIHDDYVPAVPTEPPPAKQEPGQRPARAVPYELHVKGKVDDAAGTVAVAFSNTGKSAAVFQVRSTNDANSPWTYTVGAGDHVDETWAFRADGETAYDLSIYGPNGFLRTFAGKLSGPGAAHPANLVVESQYHAGFSAITLVVRNAGEALSIVRVSDGYGDEDLTRPLRPGEAFERTWTLERSAGWYDLLVEVESDHTFERRLAGHVEDGRDSFSDPAIGGRRRSRRR
ncbi:MAG TPA: phospholipase C, phosphocholine-specific [Polyangia bacterium]|nr:phospholipase C, phosphocholine-specific [Polyangia bacterium]